MTSAEVIFSLPSRTPITSARTLDLWVVFRGAVS